MLLPLFRSMGFPIGRSKKLTLRGHRLAQGIDHRAQSQAREDPTVSVTERGGRSNRTVSRKGAAKVSLPQSLRYIGPALSSGFGKIDVFDDLPSLEKAGHGNAKLRTSHAAPRLRHAATENWISS